MKPGIAIIVVIVTAVILVVLSLNAANASHCHDTVNTPAFTPERLIYQPDGSAQYCRTYSNGVTYCR